MTEETLKNPLSIIGEEDIIKGFSALGFKTYTLTQPEGFKPILEEVIQKNMLVCLVQDNIYTAVKEQIDAYKNLAFPVFIPLAKSTKINLLDNIAKEIRLRATGAF